MPLVRTSGPIPGSVLPVPVGAHSSSGRQHANVLGLVVAARSWSSLEPPGPEEASKGRVR